MKEYKKAFGGGVVVCFNQYFKMKPEVTMLNEPGSKKKKKKGNGGFLGEMLVDAFSEMPKVGWTL